jgi:LysM repeat protein
MSLNPSGAGARLLNMGHVTPGLCLEHVAQAILEGTPYPLHAGTALESWEQNAEKHAGSGPKDFPVYFSFEEDGDVAISCGDGTVIGTHGTSVVHQTVGQRETQLGGHLLGWSSDLLGVELAIPSPPPPPPAPTEQFYIVKPGDNLSRIAEQYGETLAHLEALNPQIKNPNLIYAGEQVRVR